MFESKESTLLVTMLFCPKFANQIFPSTCCIRPKRVTNWRKQFPIRCTANNTAPFEEILQRWRAIGIIVSDLISPRFEPQTSRAED